MQIIHQKKKIYDFIKKNGPPRYLIHAAWGEMQSPLSNYHLKENFYYSKNLFDVFFKNSLNTFIFIGTINEYGSKKGIIKENDKPGKNLRNYEKGKAKFAIYAKKKAKKLNKIFIHIRLSNLYGSLQKKNSLIYTLHKAYQKKEVLNISSLKFYRDYLFSEEAAIAIVKIMRKVKKTMTINVGSGKNIYMRNFVKLYWKLLGGKVNKIKFGKLKKSKSDPKASKSRLNLNLLKKTVGWLPKNKLKGNIKKNIKYFKVANG